MKSHFVDTGAFIAQVMTDDPYHQQAQLIAAKLQQENSTGLTTDSVVSETLTFLRRRLGHRASVQFYQALQSSSNLTIVYTEKRDFESGFEVFDKYHDQDFSFVDCTSFAVMRHYKIRRAFSFDKHFEQIGFELVKPIS